jgi:uncharacterized membrane protein
LNKLMSRKSQLSKRKDDRPIMREGVLLESRVHYSGPLPPARQVEEYDRIHPGFAKALLEMAQKAQEHAHDMDRKGLDFQKEFTLRHHKYFGRGQIIGAVIGIFSIGAGIVFGMNGSPTAGASVVGAVVGLFASAFAWGKYQERNAEAQKE